MSRASYDAKLNDIAKVNGNVQWQYFKANREAKLNGKAVQVFDIARDILGQDHKVDRSTFRHFSHRKSD